MKQKGTYRINISAPNLMNICIDASKDGEWSGRLYHCYNDGAILFSNVLELLKEFEIMFDRIGFPQASTKTRHFLKKEDVKQEKPKKVKDQKDLMQYEGQMGTFIVYVRYRQNSTWQGEMYWKEKDFKYSFFNVLEFVKQIDDAIAKIN